MQRMAPPEHGRPSDARWRVGTERAALLTTSVGRACVTTRSANSDLDDCPLRTPTLPTEIRGDTVLETTTSPLRLERLSCADHLTSNYGCPHKPTLRGTACQVEELYE